MHYAKPNYKLGENIYKLIDDITQASTTTIEISSNLLFQLSNLFESIEDEIHGFSLFRKMNYKK